MHRPPQRLSHGPAEWTHELAHGAEDTPWGLGGHIAFLDGHVLFYTELGTEDGQLVNPTDWSANSQDERHLHPGSNQRSTDVQLRWLS